MRRAAARNEPQVGKLGTTALLPRVDVDLAASAVAGVAAAVGVVSAVASTSAGAHMLGFGDGTAPPTELTALLPFTLIALFALSLRRTRWFGTVIDTGKSMYGCWAVFAVLACVGTAVIGRVLGGHATIAAVLTCFVLGVAGAWIVAELTWRIPLRELRHVEPGQVWWADVQFEESHQSKDRPCLVLSSGRRNHKVLMFTSTDKTGRAGYACVPPQMWRDGRQSYLKTDRIIRLRAERLRRQEFTHVPQPVLDAARAAQPHIAKF